MTESTDLANYAVAGDCSENSVSVVVDASGAVPTTQPVCGAGRWSATLNISDLSGTISLSALQTDAADNLGRAAERTIEIEEVTRYFEQQKLAVGTIITVVPLQRIKKSFAGGIMLTENWEMIAQRIQVIRSMWWMEITAQIILQISLKLQLGQ